MVVTTDRDLAERMRMITVHGSRVRYYHEIIGVNSRLDTLQAAILAVKLLHLERWNSARQRFAARYDELLKGTPVVVPYVSRSGQHIFHQYTLRAPRRDALATYLSSKGIPHAIHYPVPLHLQRAFAVTGNKKGDFPLAEKAAEEVISLPMHTQLTEEHMIFVTDAVREFYASS
jgi:dTDP-4-amino-4,6-dideoxygalactose transaminase